MTRDEFIRTCAAAEAIASAAAQSETVIELTCTERARKRGVQEARRAVRSARRAGRTEFFRFVSEVAAQAATSEPKALPK